MITMPITEKLKESIIIVVAGTAVAAFGLGWAAYKATLLAADQMTISRTAFAELERRAREAASAPPSGQASRAVPGDCIPKQTVESDYVLRGQATALGESVRRVDATKWRYLAMPGASGDQVAARLTEIGPAEDSVVVEYDSSVKNTFHVWYAGGGTGTRFQYDFAQPHVLKSNPAFNFFRSEPGLVPAGIGGVGNEAVPIFFRVSR
jgi:hypothetical protein